MTGNTKKMIGMLSAASAFLLTSGCKKSEPASGGPAPDTVAAAPAKMQLVSIDVGNHAGADKKISTATTSFAPNDTMYLAVTTQGSESNATLGTRWTKGPDLVKEMDGTVSGTGPPVVTSFHIENTAGWPKGDYKVEVFLDGNSVGSKTLTVK